MGLLIFDKFFFTKYHVRTSFACKYITLVDVSNFVLVKLENVPTIHLFFMLARRDGISLSFNSLPQSISSPNYQLSRDTFFSTFQLRL